MIAKLCKVSGKVQGVCFRASTQEEAWRIGHLCGWVKNLADGSVQVFVQGQEDKVELLIAWLHVGPEYASVRSVDIDPAKVQSQLTGFNILHA
jgi:acylphosphatase